MKTAPLIGLVCTALAAADFSQAASRGGASADVIEKAKEYIKDGLKDPFSAEFRHVTVSVTGPHTLNVCGYVYAKNRYGVYNGGSQFVVGLENGRPVGIVSELGGGPYGLEERAAISSYGHAICMRPFSELYRHVLDMITAEIDADLVAKAAVDRCEQQRDAQEEAIHGETGLAYGDHLTQILEDSNACIVAVATAHRAAYSRILGQNYSGPMGIHSPSWIASY